MFVYSSLFDLWLRTVATGLDQIASFCDSIYQSDRIDYIKLVGQSTTQEDVYGKQITSVLLEVEECPGQPTLPPGPAGDRQPAVRHACD